MPKAGFIEVLIKRRQESLTGLLDSRWGIATHTQPGFNKWPDQPRPNSPLVIAAVPLHDIAIIRSAVPGFLRRKASQPLRSQERDLDRLDHRTGRFGFEQAEREATDGEDLVGAQAGISSSHPVIAINHIEEAPSGFVPEAFSKNFNAGMEESFPARILLCADPECI